MHRVRERILDDALGLPLAERAEVAAALLASLDGAPEQDADEAWAAEIERRAERVRSGEARGRTWDLVRADLERSRE